MPSRNQDLHGSAPDKCEVALLLVDVINDLDFPEAKQMVDAAEQMAREIARLKRRARKAGVPVIYVNDNLGKCRSDFNRTIKHCTAAKSRGRKVAQILRPSPNDYFVLKPKHSGFFSTTLETLLRYLGSKRLILTGIAGNFCVLFTANDAYMRDLHLLVPSDCTVSNTKKENNSALMLMKKFLKADTRSSSRIVFRDSKRKLEQRSRSRRNTARSKVSIR